MTVLRSNPYQPTAVPAAPSLFDRIRSWLDGDALSMPLDRAIAALVVHAATLRGPASAARHARIKALLGQYLRRDRPAVARLIAEAQRDDDRAADLHHFARVVNRFLPQEDRLPVLAMAAEVAFADRAGAEEQGFLRLLGGLLGISDRDRGVAQKRARAAAAPRCAAATS